jgi:carbon monoxide dehydrogenase subunit G
LETSYVTVNEFAVHCAYNVKLAVCPCVYGNEIAVPPLDATNHPANEYPARVGEPGDAAIEPPVDVEPFETALPPCESYVTVNEFAVHCAYNVKLAVCPCVYGNEIALPPLDATNHPANEYPARVGEPGDAAIEPPVDVEPFETALPPCESYVTVNEFAVHCAYNVKLAV